ncbi:YiiD C-terminal domain-containing protein [Arenimonas composti]|uniref:Thioesterase putative domain-containing protein n=1 Tax=Arenimonas composti TR7-09 = DSM 18010 TaxID=1121013 RepID=A0A091C1W7_9GAMM|nr:YiiD C-terminal domain-containing protein [Arenimonas composti]KFN50635.1 hypothetical protein P873_05600 [Arenimonas composti TR7-09 = DSM 18010]
MTPLEALAAQFRAMPPVAAMALEPVAWNGDVLEVRAPLAANVNDKGSAFGGSLAGAMTLAGWGLLTLKLAGAGLAAEVYVADSRIRYLKPLKADLFASAWLAPGSDWPTTIEVFAARGRARVELVARVAAGDGTACAELEGRFALIRVS